MPPSWADAREEHRRRLRRHIVRTAMELVGERGVAGTSMSQLAERAGVSRATLYNYVPDLEHALLAYVSDEVERFHRELVDNLAESSDPIDRLRVYVRSQLDYFASQEHRVGVEHLERSGLSPKIVDAVHARVDILRDVLAEVLRTARDAGELRTEIDIDLQVELIHGLLGTAREWMLRQERSPAEATHDILDLLLRGLGTHT